MCGHSVLAASPLSSARASMPAMEGLQDPDGSVTLRISQAEAVELHQAIAGTEFELAEIELRQPVEQKVFSDVQQALVSLIPGLGTDEYQATVDRAYAEIDPTPY